MAFFLAWEAFVGNVPRMIPHLCLKKKSSEDQLAHADYTLYARISPQ